MRVIRGLNSIGESLSGCVLTLGNFDGMHRGHQALIAEVVNMSKIIREPSAVMTFDPHPARVLHPESPVPRLFPMKDLEERLLILGVDVLVVEPFTKQLAQKSADEFIQNLIWPLLHPREIFIGYDFAFGRGREGTATLLRGWGKKFGYGVHQLQPVLKDGEVVSSSLIRELITAGQVEHAAQLLGRPFYLEGEIVNGEGRGRALGFSTANLQTSGEVLPAIGVYVTHMVIEGRSLPAVTNVGRKPTFHVSHGLSIETHVLETDTSFYGKTVKVEFLKRIRPELKFPSANELINQIQQDISETKKYFG